jgi:hypothetical protein
MHSTLARLRSLLSLGMFAGSSANAALFYQLAIGTLRHHPLPMVRVDAPAPAKIGASTRFSDADRDRSQAQKVE